LEEEEEKQGLNAAIFIRMLAAMLGEESLYSEEDERHIRKVK
jgi:hypothetical protein